MFKEIAISALSILLTTSNLNSNLVKNFTNEYKNKGNDKVSSILKQKEEEIKDPMDLISGKELILEMYIPATDSELAHYERYRTKIEPISKTGDFYQDYKEIFKEKGIEEKNIFSLHQLKSSYSDWLDWTVISYNKESNYNAHFIVLNEIDEEKKTLNFTEYDVFDNPKGDTYGENKGPLDIAIKTDITLDYSEFKNLNDIDSFKVTKKNSFDQTTTGYLYSLAKYHFEAKSPDFIGTLNVLADALPEMDKPSSSSHRAGTAKKNMKFNIKTIYIDKNDTKWYQIENNTYIGAKDNQIEFIPSAKTFEEKVTNEKDS